jgi:hypothetical protein
MQQVGSVAIGIPEEGEKGRPAFVPRMDLAFCMGLITSCS